MKVLYWTELFLPHIGGVEVFSAQLIKALLKLGHKIEVITSHSGVKLPDVSEKQGIRIHRFHFQKALIQRDLREIKQISERVISLKEHFKPDLIHVNTVQPSLFFFHHTRTFQPVPACITLHQPPVGLSKNNSLLRRVLSSADWVTAVSSHLLTRMIDYAPETEFKSSVIPNGLEGPSLKPAPLSFDKPNILGLGRLIKDKGFDLAIDSLKNIIERFPEAKLVISGDGPERKELENKVRKMDLLDTVHFTGWISPEKVPELIDNALMVVVPSRWEEPFGLVALQAAQMGRPVVASKTGGIPEVVLDGKTGLLFEKDNVKDLAEKIMFLIKNPKKSVEMGKAARKRAQTDFNIEMVSEKYDSLYQRLNPRTYS